MARDVRDVLEGDDFGEVPAEGAVRAREVADVLKLVHPASSAHPPSTEREREEQKRDTC